MSSDAALDEALARLAAVEAQVAEMAAKLAFLHHDDIGRAQALAEDALARAGNAQALADDALQQAARARAQGEDAGAAAANAATLAEDGHQRAAAAAAGAEDTAATAVARAEDAAATAEARAADASATAALALDTAQDVLLPTRIAALAVWLELCPPLETEGPLVSVILPTRDRPALLPRAVASVLEQLYVCWELVVVDDGETDAVTQALAHIDDAGVVVVDGPRRGLGAARNAGLDRARGEVVCYLDDDNVMHPAWLRAVAYVFLARPEMDVAYGVTLAEHRRAGLVKGDDWWPSPWQLPWSRETLLEQNVTDAGALAHSRDLPQARFDEGLDTGEDWDLLLRLTESRDALAIPAISHAYTLEGPDRMSHAPGHVDGLSQIRRKHAGR